VWRLRSAPDAPGDLAGGDAHSDERGFWRRKDRPPLPSLPAIVATLPGDEAEFSRELDHRIRERFPIGTSEDELIDYLKNEQFLPEWRRRNEDNSLPSNAPSGLHAAKIRFPNDCGAGEFQG
jgi:hypothetical protein